MDCRSALRPTLRATVRFVSTGSANAPVRRFTTGCPQLQFSRLCRARPVRLVRPSEAYFCCMDQRRWHSAQPTKSRVYSYEEVKFIAEQASPSSILIDVREPSEFQAGAIPSAVNVPISSQPDALLLPPDEFEERFGFEKPDKSTEVVFYCKAGVRSSAAARLAEQGGYEKIGEYRGSWLDWAKREIGG